MLTIFQAIVLGIVEGITEFLPISSTGHMILVSALMHIQETDFVKSFEIIIQLGSILAVVVLYFKTLLVNWKVLSRVIVGFIPTGIIGLTVYKILKQYLLGNTSIVLWSLLIGGVLLIVFEHYHKEPAGESESLENITYRDAAIIGLFQAIAIIPGVSRSAATIVGGLLLGYKRKTVVEFSFLLAVPTMLAATGLDLLKNHSALSGGATVLAVGFITSFIVALIAVKWLLKFIKNHTFTGFGIYRIAAAILGFIILK